MRPRRFFAYPPGASAIGLRTLARVVQRSDGAEVLRRGLGGMLDGRTITFHASGREALRVALAHLSRQAGRDEVVVPAYTCFSVPSAVAAAGLRVRLVDVDESGRVDVAALARLPLESAAALVVCNLFGNPEPVRELQRLLEPAGVALLDDAAQALGARAAEGSVGARGEVGVLSFGRGKPLSALGGGAVAWRPETPELPSEPLPSPRPIPACVRAVAYDVALNPLVFPWLEAVPALGIGETHFDDDFERGMLDGRALALAAALVSEVQPAGRRRAEVARRLSGALKERTAFVPIEPPEGVETAAPRLPVLAPDSGSRDRALEALRGRGVGASAMYPSSLDEVPALRPHVVGLGDYPGARDVAARLLTLPTYRVPGEREIDTLMDVLAAVAPLSPGARTA